MRSVYSAANGLSTFQKRIDTVAHNLANVNTVGFKSSRLDFKDMVYHNIYREGVWNPNNNLQMGHGSTVSQIVRNMEAGKTLPGDMYDVALEGEGYFAVRMQDGQIAYTRDGTFQVDHNGQLLTSRGQAVLDMNGNNIVLGTSQYEIDKNGMITANGLTVAQLGVFVCDNPKGMSAMGDNMFQPTANSGGMAQAPIGSFRTMQGYYESSNVDMAQEFTYLIRAQRAMTMVSRALQTADEMDARANALRQ